MIFLVVDLVLLLNYEVDSFGRISSINMINPGTDYNLATTLVQVDNPRGGESLLRVNYVLLKR